jgi:tetratricopeptide (TPR) repeat protein
MATINEQATTATDAAARAGLAIRVRSAVGRVRGLPALARKRPLVAVGAGGAMLAVVGACGVLAWWLWVGRQDRDENLTLAAAFEAYDAYDLITARDIAEKLHERRLLPFQESGGPLFVLGAAAARDAETEVDDVRRRQLYRVASRHLEEADDYGFPPDRRAEGTYLLARCLFEGGQYARSIAALREAIELNPHRSAALVRMLADAYFHDSPPRYDEALSQLARYLATPGLSPWDRDSAVLQQARIKLDQGRFDDARASLAEVADDSPLRSEQLVLEGLLAIREGDRIAGSKDAPDAAAAQPYYAAAVEAFRMAEGTDTTRNQTTPKAEYLLGIAYRKLGESTVAEKQFDRIARLRAVSEEGVASVLEAAELKGELGDLQGSLADYRKLLKAVGKPESYQNQWLRLDDLKRRIEAGYLRFRDAGDFPAAVELAQAMWPLVDRDLAVELEAQAMQAWGEDRLEQAAAAAPGESETLAQAGRTHLREAGRVYARLAKLRKTARSYPDELWNSAQAFLQGNDFKHAVVMLDGYLESVSRTRRPQALVTLGEAQLSLDMPAEALVPLRECINDFATHPDTYRARLLAARAYLELDKLPDQALLHLPKAEQLLDANLHNDTLTPRSVEWRDSLFELGRLYFRQGLLLEQQARSAGLHSDDPRKAKQALEVLEQSQAAFQQAREKLSEAAQRYPEDRQTLEARYLLAEAHRHAAAYAQLRRDRAPVEAMRLALRLQSQQELAQAALVFERLVVDLNQLSDRRDLSEIELGILRCAYLGKADALFGQEKYDEALTAYGAAADRFHDRPEALDALVQMARCQRERGRLDLARGALERARATIERIPADANFMSATPYDRAGWQQLLEWLIALYSKKQGEV